MGLTTFDRIAAEMMVRGRAADTPAMAVRWGTRPDQETLVGTLGTLGSLIHQHGHEASRHHRGGGSGGAAGEAELVRAAAPVRPPGSW